MQLRRVSALLTATPITAEGTVTLADGTSLLAYVGDWLVYQDKTPINVVRAAAFPAPYEVVITGTLLLSPEERTRLEATTGVGTTRTGLDLCAAVERLAKITIGEIAIPFTPGQLEELTHRAVKRGRSVAQEIQAVVDRIKEELFWRS